VKIFAAIGLLLLLGAAPACDFPPPNDKSAKVSDKHPIDEEAIKRKLNERLDAVQKKIDSLKERERPLTERARHELDEQQRFLEAKSKELRERLNTEQKRDEAWRKLRDSTESALNEIERKIDDLSTPRKP